MRTLDQLLDQILDYYHEAGLSIEDAVDKSAPWDDLDPLETELLVRVGLLDRVSNKLEAARRHGDGGRAKRAYLGRMQHRPETEATALAVYDNLWATFDVDGGSLPIIQFDRSHVGFQRERVQREIAGYQRHLEFWDWLDSKLTTKKRVVQLSRSVLEEANKRAGEAFK